MDVDSKRIGAASKRVDFVQQVVKFYSFSGLIDSKRVKNVQPHEIIGSKRVVRGSQRAKQNKQRKLV